MRAEHGYAYTGGVISWSDGRPRAETLTGLAKSWRRRARAPVDDTRTWNFVEGVDQHCQRLLKTPRLPRACDFQLYLPLLPSRDNVLLN